MANTKDINSTEKLLNVIRGTEQPLSAPVDGAEAISSRQNNSSKTFGNFSKIFPGKKRFKVGVDIGHTVIRFVKMAKSSDGRPTLVARKNVPLEGQLKKGSSEFSDLLKSSLTAFAGSLDDCEIWTMMSAADVNLLHIKIPRVPKKQLSNVIFWTAKKENPIDEQEMIFDYEMHGEVIDNGTPKYAVMVYTVPRSEVKKVQNMFSSAGINLDGITIAPFAIQNIFRTKWVDTRESTFATIFIGNNFSRIDIYSQNNLMMTRGIKAGINSMMEAIDEAASEISFDGKANKENIEKILKDFSADPEKWMKDKDIINWAESGILETITPAMERLVRQIERTLEYYSAIPGNQKVEKVYISSLRSMFYHLLLQYISEQVGTRSDLLDPFQDKSAAAIGASLTIDESAAMVPTIGLALSDRNFTPNVLFTYVHKQREALGKRINYGVITAFAAVLIICVGIIINEGIQTSNTMARKMTLETELSLLQPLLTKEKITTLTNEFKARQQTDSQYFQKYTGMAFIGELSSLTPEKIRLINLQINMPVAGGQEPKKDAAQKEEGVSIEGVVLGERNELDELLAQYVMKLENSEMIRTVTLQKSNIVKFKEKEILQFTINAKIG